MARLGVDDDDYLEKSSTYSIFNQSQANFNTVGGLTEDNMDEYLESLLQKERDKYSDANKIFFDNNTALKEIRERQDHQMNQIMREDWGDDLADLKELNQVNLNQFVKEYQEAELIQPSAPLEMADEKILRNDLLRDKQIEFENQIL